MDVIHERAAGMDISKRDAKVCVRVPGKRAETFEQKVTTWGSTTSSVLALREMLIAERVTTIVMEATSDYWKPFYYLLEDGLPVTLVNARDVRNLPGRKTDVSDAVWLAQLAAHGLVRASFVPPEPVRELRDLTRTRATIVRDRAREIQRIEKVLEDAGIKLSSVASDLTGVSGRAMLDALVAGERDPHVLAGLAKARLRAKTPELVEALTGRFREHHAFMVKLHLTQLDHDTEAIDELTNRIEVVIEPFRALRDALTTIPGFSTRVADVVIAETGGNMAVFPTAAHLASWAGVCPGSNESAGRVKSSKTRPGNNHLKGALGVAAMSASRQKNTYFAVKYRRIAAHRGPLKALVALEHTMLVAVWNMATTGETFNDLGADYYAKRKPDKVKNRAIAQLREIGYNVSLTPIAV
jgi:transposase